MSEIAGVQKYLERWAEPEARKTWARLEKYYAALVIPALGEAPTLLDGFRDAAKHAPGRVLMVLVINGARETSAPLLAASRALLDELLRRSEPLQGGGALLREREFDALLVDRVSPGLEVPRRQGVGLARKIGMDIAFSLFSQRRLELPWVFSSDADAMLPTDYFRAAERLAESRATALIYTFEHVAGEDRLVHEATQAYEVMLRYHALGLAWAGSPYAYHTLGSALAVNLSAYAAVRGVPKRSAGEDFYLLDKLAKLGPIFRLQSNAVAIRSRRSARAPFGTGPQVEAMLKGEQARVASPAAFAALRAVLTGIDAFCETRDPAEFRRAAEAFGQFAELERLVEASGLVEAARSANLVVGSGSLRRRLHTWFDALKTLRFLHALRVSMAPDEPILRALAGAPFVGPRAGESMGAVLEHLRALERNLPQAVGPSLYGGSIGAERTD